MWKRIKDWGSVEIERLKASNLKETKRSHTWIARVWTNDTVGPHEYLLSVPYDTSEQLKALKKALGVSRAKYKVTSHKVEMDGEYVL